MTRDDPLRYVLCLWPDDTGYPCGLRIGHRGDHNCGGRLSPQTPRRHMSDHVDPFAGATGAKLADGTPVNDDGSLPLRQTPPSSKAQEISDRIERARHQARATRTREQVIEEGRRLGEHGADMAGETGADREARIRRAVDFALWEYDGKPYKSNE